MKKSAEKSERLSRFERLLTLWIFLAMVAGVSLGYIYPPIGDLISSLSVGTTSLPIALGLILMMYPPLAKVKYEAMPQSLGFAMILERQRGKLPLEMKKKAYLNLKLLGFSLFQNWIAGPLVMWILAVLLLRDYPGYMMGVILVGLARCIAMVIVWNDLAEGDRELAVGLVSFNAIFQVLFYAVYIYLFITLGLKLIGFGEVQAEVSIKEAAKTVFIYLGIPFIMGLITRYGSFALKGRVWFEKVLSPKISFITPAALLYTIVLMFSLKGQLIVELPLHVLRVALPLTLYFLIMWFVTFFVTYRLGVEYPKATAVSFTAASNDFELAIAVAVAIWGIQSDQAFATVIGPLLEVPILIFLVNVALKLRERLYREGN
ncbi:arsenic resistance protein ArsB [Caldimicrobium thiodismutans]|uniref:Arsenic resistance protein ArsB n=1 Tax=Caldimicrobium thiodismutans TaxID=1653476 RepID=A0A0U5AWL9_9BACT|nr:ACR3 family arsenite efflux transporter [Caldimicrobium thiodismutans]BAU23752.1 arsenic resistance protein ArsB [Caldimicrobium thiodismutans]